MHIKVEDFKDLLDKDCFEEGYVKNVASHLANFIINFFEIYNKYLLQNITIDIADKVKCDVYKLDALIADALADIKRIKMFHPVKKPATIKFTAYIAYWFLKHKPLDIVYVQENTIDEIERFKLLNINEYFCTQFIFSMVFDTSNFYCDKYYQNFNYLKDLKVSQNYLLYYLRYREPSARDIDAYMNALIVHPAYKFNKGVKIGVE